MDIQRIRYEVRDAQTYFPWVEVHPTVEGGVAVKAALQTSVGNVYVILIGFLNYPSQMPRVTITQPALRACPHRYNTGHICYLQPQYVESGAARREVRPGARREMA